LLDPIKLVNKFIVFGIFCSKTKTYQILGATETDPTSGTISYSSPLGAALMNKHEGETIKISLTNKETYYKIIKIE
jgi:transcription elongation factor GreA